MSKISFLISSYSKPSSELVQNLINTNNERVHYVKSLTHLVHTLIISRHGGFVGIGSATFGGVYDLVMEDCVIGDDNGSSPWAIKYKSHQSYPGTMQNHTFRRLRVGNIQPNSVREGY